MQYEVFLLPPGGAQMGISHGQHLPDLSNDRLPLYLFQLESIATAFQLYPQTPPSPPQESGSQNYSHNPADGISLIKPMKDQPSSGGLLCATQNQPPAAHAPL